MKQKHSARKHSDYSASASERWMECAASVELAKKAPPQKFESKFAVEGTKAHECLEFIVKLFPRASHAQLKTQALKKWPEEMVMHALNCAKIIYKLRPSPSAQLLVETRVDLSYIKSDMFGTLDYAWVDVWGKLIVIDYKYGAGVPVLPIDDETGKENSQLMFYAAGVAHRFHYDFTSVELAVIQPRVWRDGEDPLTLGVTSVKRLLEFEKELKEAVRRTKQPGIEPKAGSHCRWCPAASFCPAVSTFQMESAGILFDAATAEVTAPELDAIADTKLGGLLKAADILEQWIEKLRAHAFSRAVEGAKIDGRKLVEKKTIRQWDALAEKMAFAKFGKKAFSSPELLSPSKLEKALGKDAKDFTKHYTFNKVTGYTLAKATDSRPEVSNVSPFDAIEDLEEWD